MTKIKVLFGRKIDEPDYTEALITEVEERIPEAEAWAADNGYVTRVAEIDIDEPPDLERERSHEHGYVR